MTECYASYDGGYDLKIVDKKNNTGARNEMYLMLYTYNEVIVTVKI